MNSLGLLYPRIGEASLQELAKNFYEEVGKIPELRSLYPGDLEAAERRIYFLFRYLEALKPIPKNEVTPGFACATCNGKLIPK